MKKLIISEEQEKNLVKIIKSPNGIKVNKYTIDPNKVLIVKKFLDGGFKRGKLSTVGNDGLPFMMPIIAMMDENGEVLKNLYKEQLLELMIDKYQSMFRNKDERRKFLNQVLNDWYDNKIGTFGTLSVNGLA